MFYPKLEDYIVSLSQEFPLIGKERKQDLLKITRFIEKKIEEKSIAALIFICTHNSRRSHFGQIWAQALAEWYGINNVQTYSGGTEATAFNPNAIQACMEAGFVIESDGTSMNPLYRINYSQNSETITAWSKKYNDPENPQSKFCAVMTCTDADENCPIITGAELRVALPYEDPKKSDGTPSQAETYAERCRQIAREMAFIFWSLEE